MISLVAIDLDGTLLDDAKRVSEQTVAEIARATARGIKIVLASARPPRSTRKIYQQLELDTWQINYNGALIWDEPKNRVVHHEPMDGATVLAVATAARAHHEPIVVHCEILDRWHTDRHEQPYTTETGRTFSPDFYAPLEEICRQPITKLNLLGSPEVINRIEPDLIARFGDRIAFVRAGENELLLGMSRLAGKSAALRRVVEHYGIALENVLAVGDAPNDVGMLQLAGIGVAMRDAHPRVKEVADWIAPSNNDHGVSEALKRFL